MISKAFVFIKRGWITLISYKMAFVLKYIGLFLNVTMFYYLSKLMMGTANPYMSQYGGDYTAFIIIGVSFQSFVSTALQSFSASITREQSTGTLEFLLMSETRLSQTLLFSALWNFILVLINTSIIFIFAIFIFDIHFQSNIVVAGTILVLALLAFSGIGMMSAAMIIVFKQGDPLEWIFSMISGLLSGVFFPVKVLPEFLQKISLFLPNTYALEALRKSLLNNTSLSTVGKEIAVLFLFSMITIPAGIILFHWGFNRARKDGSLVHY
jgi:ABC-2 type transport system permease protein